MERMLESCWFRKSASGCIDVKTKEPTKKVGLSKKGVLIRGGVNGISGFLLALR